MPGAHVCRPEKMTTIGKHVQRRRSRTKSKNRLWLPESMKRSLFASFGGAERRQPSRQKQPKLQKNQWRAEGLVTRAIASYAISLAHAHRVPQAVKTPARCRRWGSMRLIALRYRRWPRSMAGRGRNQARWRASADRSDGVRSNDGSQITHQRTAALEARLWSLRVMIRPNPDQCTVCI
jgi:hypothetical protein